MYILYSTDPSGAPTRLMLAMTWLEREKMAGLSPGLVLNWPNGMEASLQVKTAMVVYSVGVHMNTDSSKTPTISPEKTFTRTSRNKGEISNYLARREFYICKFPQ